MSKIRIQREEDLSQFTVKELLRERGRPEAVIAALSDNSLNSTIRIYEEGSTSAPQLFESHVLPDTVAPVHCHDEDEIIYILEGEMLFGNQSLKKGASLFVKAKARYGFRAGPAGVRFLNFRPRKCDF